MKDLIIVGARGFGRNVSWMVERINAQSPTYNILGFLDDKADLQNTEIHGYRVLGGIDDAVKYNDAYFVCAFGVSKTREKFIQRLESLVPDIKFETLIDPSAIVSDYAEIGEGSIICAGSIILVDIKIGKHVLLHVDCTVGHDAVINDFVTVFPSVNISGYDNIGRGCEIGVGTQIVQNHTIGEYSIIGAGSVVVKDIPANCTAVGCPAKPIKFFKQTGD